VKVTTPALFFKGKKVLITGHTGFKGAWLTAWLLRAGSEVAGFAKAVPTGPSLYSSLDLGLHIRDFRNDIRDELALKQALLEFKPEIIFHLAAQSLVSEGYKNPKETFDTNIGGAINIFENLKVTSSIKSTVIVTSDKCYFPKKTPCVETDSLGGLDPYSASKACVELVFQSYKGQLKGNVATARGCNVLGGGDWLRTRIIPDCIFAQSTSEIVQLRRPKAVRSWIFILDILNGYLKLAQSQYECNIPLADSFNFGSKESCQVSDLVEKMGFKYGVDSRFQYDENDCLLVDSTKADKILDWRPRYSLDQTVLETKLWYDHYLIDSRNAKEIMETSFRNFDQSLI
jgi:CDP-glucose 4,6-dehydratase